MIRFMQYLAVFLVATVPLFADWVLVIDGVVVERFKELPEGHPAFVAKLCEVSPDVDVGSVKDGTNWVSAAALRAAAEAQRQAVIAAKAQAVTKLAKKYRAVLRAHYGDGAETNRGVTVTRVSTDMLDADDAEWPARDILILTKGFETLRDITGTDETWTFPWHLIED
jgi:hypothetical protein